MASDRAPFIDQSQSMNIYMANSTISKMTSAHFHAWKSGLKTLCYYVRTKAISTGAKHLALDIQEVDIAKPQQPEFTTPPVLSQETSRPEDSQFECFGCSS